MAKDQTKNFKLKIDVEGEGKLASAVRQFNSAIKNFDLNGLLAIAGAASLLTKIGNKAYSMKINLDVANYDMVQKQLNYINRLVKAPKDKVSSEGGRNVIGSKRYFRTMEEAMIGLTDEEAARKWFSATPKKSSSPRIPKEKLQLLMSSTMESGTELAMAELFNKIPKTDVQEFIKRLEKRRVISKGKDGIAKFDFSMYHDKPEIAREKLGGFLNSINDMESDPRFVKLTTTRAFKKLTKTYHKAVSQFLTDSEPTAYEMTNDEKVADRQLRERLNKVSANRKKVNELHERGIKLSDQVMYVPRKLNQESLEKYRSKIDASGFDSPELTRLRGVVGDLMIKANMYKRVGKSTDTIANLEPTLQALESVPKEIANALKAARDTLVKEAKKPLDYNKQAYITRHGKDIKGIAEDFSPKEIDIKIGQLTSRIKQAKSDVNSLQKSITTINNEENQAGLEKLKIASANLAKLEKEKVLLVEAKKIKSVKVSEETKVDKKQESEQLKGIHKTKKDIEQTEQRALAAATRQKILEGERFNVLKIQEDQRKILVDLQRAQNLLLEVQNKLLTTTDQKMKNIYLTQQKRLTSYLKTKESEFQVSRDIIRDRGAHSYTFGQSISLAMKQYLSLDRIVARMSFVWTAMWSYKILGYIQGIFAEAMNGAKELEQAMNRINSIMTKFQQQYSKNIEDSIMRMSMKYGQEISKLGAAAYEMVSSNVSPSAVPEMLEVSTKMAAAGLTDVTNATNLMISAVNTYGYSMSELTDISDLYFQMVKYGRTTVEQLNKNFGVVASTASLLGISIEDVGASLSVMTNAGIDTDQAITSLNQLLLNFAKGGSAKAKQAAARLGFEINSNAIKSEGMIGLIKKLEGATEEEMVALAGSTRAFKALGNAINQAGTYSEFYNGMVNRHGSTQTAFNEVQKSTTFQMQQTRKEFINFGIRMSKDVLPTIRMLADLLKFTSKQFGLMSSRVVLSTVTGIAFALALKKIIGYFYATAAAAGVASKSITTLNTVMSRTPILLISMAAITVLSYAWNSLLNSGESLNKQIKELSINSKKTKEEMKESTEEYKRQEFQYKRLIDMVTKYKKKLQESKTEEDKASNFKMLKGYLSELTKQYPKFFEKLDIEKIKMENLSSVWTSYKKAIDDTTEALKNNTEYKRQNAIANIYSEKYAGLAIKKEESETEFRKFATMDRIGNLKFKGNLRPNVGNIDVSGISDNNKIAYVMSETLSRLIYNNNASYEEIKDYVNIEYSGIESKVKEAIKQRDTILNSMNEIDKQQQKVEKKLIALNSNSGLDTTEPKEPPKEFNSVFDDLVDRFRKAFELKDAPTRIKELKDAYAKEWLRLKKGFLEQGMDSQNIEAERRKFFRGQDQMIFDAVKTSVGNSVKELQKRFKSATTTEEQQKIVDEMKSIYEIFKDYAKQYGFESDFTEYFEQMLGHTVSGMQTTVDKWKEYAKTMAAGEEGINFVREYISGLTGKGIEELSYQELEDLINDKTIHDDISKVLKVYKDVYDKVDREINKEIDSINRDHVSEKYNKRTKYNVFGTHLSSIMGFDIEDKDTRKNEKDVYEKQKSVAKDDVKFNAMSPEAQKKLQEDILEYEKKMYEERIDVAKNIISGMMDLWQQYYDYQKERISEWYNSQAEVIDRRTKYEYRSALWAEREKDKLDKARIDKERKLARVQQGMAIGKALISGALGDMQIQTVYAAFPMIAALLRVMNAVITVASIATISSQKFAKGGLVYGPSHSAGGVSAELEGGEFIFNKKATSGNEALLYNLQSLLASGRKSNNNSYTNEILKDINKSIKEQETQISIQGQILSDLDIYKKTKKGERQYVKKAV